MKLHKYKQVCRLTFFGYDDELRDADYSFSKRNPLSGAGVLYDTKLMRFRFTSINGVDLSNFAKISIETVLIPTIEEMTGDNTANVTNILTLRTSSLSSLNNFDSHNNGNDKSLIFYYDIVDGNKVRFNNNSLEHFFNFPVYKQFIQNGQLELEVSVGITDTNNRRLTQGGLDTFAITFIVYDIEEQELLLQDTPNFNKSQLKPHASINNGKNYNLNNL